MSKAYKCDLCGGYEDGYGGDMRNGSALDSKEGYERFEVQMRVTCRNSAKPELCSACLRRVIQAALNNSYDLSARMEEP